MYTEKLNSNTSQKSLLAALFFTWVQLFIALATVGVTAYFCMVVYRAYQYMKTNDRVSTPSTAIGVAAPAPEPTLKMYHQEPRVVRSREEVV